MKYIKIDTEDVCNGKGLRVVLWLSGCSHHCYKCQNPQTWNPDSGVLFEESAKEELFKELNKNYISGLTLTGGDPLYKENLDGVLDLVSTINLRYNTEFHTEYAIKDGVTLQSFQNKTRLSSPNKTIWLYTGYTWEEIMEYEYGTDYIGNFNKDALRQAIVSQCDVLVDGQYVDELRNISLKWRGSSNQNVIDVQKSLQTGEKVLWTE